MTDQEQVAQIIAALEQGETAQVSDMADWAETHLTGEEYSDDE